MHARARSIARGLVRLAKPGARVLIMAHNSSDFVQVWFGISCAGMTEVPINTAYLGGFLDHQINTAQPAIAVIDAEFAERFTVSAHRASMVYLVLGEAPEAQTAVDALRRSGCSASLFEELDTPEDQELPEPQPQDLAAILFTSGTTGPSK